MNNIFVGNLSFSATKEDLIKLFEPFGTVANAVIMERKKGKSRGYGFVDMPNEEEKNAAIAALQGKEFMWRVLSVSIVIPKEKKEPKPKSFKPQAKKDWSSLDVEPKIEKKSESKYYDKFDGPPKPWRKLSTDSKSPRKDDKQGRKSTWSKSYSKSSSNFYSGGDRDQAPAPRSSSDSSKKPYKKFDSSSKPWSKPSGASKPFSKPGTGFKMARKVSGVAKARPQKG